MTEDERVIGELRDRAKRLIDETEAMNCSLTAESQKLSGTVADCQAATLHYAMTNARGPERTALLELAHRVGQRSILFARRSDVALERHIVENDLRNINALIGGAQVLIGAGKLAEIGIGVYSMFAKAKPAIDSLKFAIQGVKKVDEIKQSVNSAKLVVDGVKAGAGLVSAVQSNKGTDYAMATGQIGAYLLRVGPDFDRTGKQLWDLIGAIRRVSSCSDLAQLASMTMQLLKLLVDFFKNLIDFIENVEPKSGLAPILGTVNTVVTSLRDLIDAGRAFIAAGEAFKEVSANATRMEAALKDQDRFIGSEQAALLKLPALRNLGSLNEDGLDALAQQTTNLQETRVVVDEARLEAEKIKEDTDAAKKYQERQRVTLSAAMGGFSTRMSGMEELLTRMRYQTQDLDFVASRGGPRALVAKELSDDLKQKSDHFQTAFAQYKLLAAAAQ